MYLLIPTPGVGPEINVHEIMGLGRYDSDVDKPIIRAIGRGRPRKSRLFWAQMALASLVANSGPKKPQFSGPTALPMALVMDVACIKIIISRGIKTTGTFIVIVYAHLPRQRGIDFGTYQCGNEVKKEC